MGATQNSQSWPIAHPPTKIAGPVLRVQEVLYADGTRSEHR